MLQRLLPVKPREVFLRAVALLVVLAAIGLALQRDDEPAVARPRNPSATSEFTVLAPVAGAPAPCDLAEVEDLVLVALAGSDFLEASAHVVEPCTGATKHVMGERLGSIAVTSGTVFATGDPFQTMDMLLELGPNTGRPVLSEGQPVHAFSVASDGAARGSGRVVAVSATPAGQKAWQLKPVCSSCVLRRTDTEFGPIAVDGDTTWLIEYRHMNRQGLGTQPVLIAIDERGKVVQRIPVPLPRVGRIVVGPGGSVAVTSVFNEPAETHVLRDSRFSELRHPYRAAAWTPSGELLAENGKVVALVAETGAPVPLFEINGQLLDLDLTKWTLP